MSSAAASSSLLAEFGPAELRDALDLRFFVQEQSARHGVQRRESVGAKRETERSVVDPWWKSTYCHEADLHLRFLLYGEDLHDDDAE